MIFERNISKYIVHIETPLTAVLEKISTVKGRVLFGVDEQNRVIGVLTNGDLIRWLSRTKNQANLNISVQHLLNKDFAYVKEGASSESIRALLSEFLFVPILDNQFHLISVVCRRSRQEQEFFIDGYKVSHNAPVFVIAEIGNNHNGSLERARRLIDAAIRAGADCAKFQIRDMGELYSNTGNADDAKENLGSQYTLDLLSRFQLSIDEMFKAFDYCKDKGIIPLCTPWDKSSVAVLEEYGMSAYKIASADLTNHDLIKTLIDTGKPLILSTGMSTELEIKKAVTLLNDGGAQYALLHCNSCYPPPFKDIHLSYISRLKELSQTIVGYSGHERGINVAIAAVACGARIVEKHLTEDTTLEGSDHKVSLLPDEFKKLVEGVRQVDSALGSINERSVSQGEEMNRATLAKSLFINQALSKGQIIEAEMLEVKSPGHGLQPSYKSELIGRDALRDLKKGDVFYPSDLENERVFEARDYEFSRNWGVPVRFHDYAELMNKTNVSLLEFHLSYKDLEVELNNFFIKKVDLDLVVHSPELFAGDHVLDLCSPDEKYRLHSIKEMQRVINFTRLLSNFFRPQKKIGIITNVGGFSESGFLPKEQKAIRLQNLILSLKTLNTEGVEIWPQTMPPFPWHFGGQRYHNIFVEAEEIVKFCKEFKYRICLDISHSKLASNFGESSFSSFLEKVSPYTAHLHIADAKGIDDEGLQIEKGEVDFSSLAKILNQKAPLASFIPEVWQGHENSGEGFWCALEKLEQYF
ncbi:MAG: acetylneuraminic acid synthetase [Cycloclasticus sp.]|mgnify:CR=1 FL=1|nr:acetylneuraminic acid synthetase [Cycloclasticus sp.]MBG96494.1 acetylneuraminic acid synthetase [Cycloclasticus sp.]